jgi:hypothetical protein
MICLDALQFGENNPTFQHGIYLRNKFLVNDFGSLS